MLLADGVREDVGGADEDRQAEGGGVIYPPSRFVYPPAFAAWRLCVLMIRSAPRDAMANPPTPRQSNWLSRAE